MTVHKFPNRPMLHPVRELGIGDIPLPPTYAIRDMDRALDRLVFALSCDESSVSMSPEIRSKAMSDRSRYREVLDCADVEGITVVQVQDINRFIHLVTGHPKAWVLSWQLHSMATAFSGMVTDRSAVAQSIRTEVGEALSAFSDSFNREFTN